MKKFRDYAEKVASQMKKGLSNENSQICEIGRVLRDSGLSHVEVNYHMNVDEDFIPDVLSSYKDKPQQGKIYSLFGGKGEPCIAKGNTWAESEVKD